MKLRRDDNWTLVMGQSIKRVNSLGGRVLLLVVKPFKVHDPRFVEKHEPTQAVDLKVGLFLAFYQRFDRQSQRFHRFAQRLVAFSQPVQALRDAVQGFINLLKTFVGCHGINATAGRER